MDPGRNEQAQLLQVQKSCCRRHRRCLLISACLFVVALIIVLIVSLSRSSTSPSAQDVLVFFGSGGCDGEDPLCVPGRTDQVHVFRLAPATDDLAQSSKLLYVNNITLGDGAIWLRTAGSCLVSTFVGSNELGTFLIGLDGLLTPVSTIDSLGVNPVHFSLLSSSSSSSSSASPTLPALLLVANYKGPDDSTDDTGAGVASFHLSVDCHLSPITAVPHSGSSVNPSRQGCAHPHSFTPDNQPVLPESIHPSEAPGIYFFAFVCDLGQDKIMTYRVHTDTGNLTEVARVSAPPGTGPRHVALHPGLRVLYVLHELASEIGVLLIADDGTLTYSQTIAMLPDDVLGINKAAELVVSANGNFLYATNRGFGVGSDSVAVFAISSNGTLAALERTAAHGRFPRGMALSPDGGRVLVAGQGSDSVAVFEINDDGTLRLTQNVSHIPSPVAMAFHQVQI